MKKLLIILLAAALTVMVLVLGGCDSADDKTPEPVPTSPEAGQNVTEPDMGPVIEDDFPPDSLPDEDIDCTLHFRSAPERNDGAYSKVYDINCGGEYVENSYVWCDAEMTGFECISVEMQEDGSFVKTGTHSYIESVKPGEAVYVTIELPEIIPNDAFVYTAGGTEYIWLIGYNGRDGGMSLSPLGVNQLRTED